MRVGIVGWFGSDNLGDEILLHALMGCVRSVAEDAFFVVFCPEPGRVAELHRVDTRPMPVLRARGAAGRQAEVQRAIKGCDLLLLGPGTVFQERSPNLAWPGTLPLFARIVAMARAAGTPVAIAGAGVREGGTPVGRGLLRVLGALCAAVGVRDQRSAAYFGSSAQIIGDLAYTLPLPQVGGPASDLRVGLSMRPLAAKVEATLLPAVAECVRRLRREQWSGAFLAMAYGRGARGENDGTLFEREYRTTMDLVPGPLDGGGPLAGALDDWLRVVATHRLIIATRLHAALLAVAVGVPTVAIAYERKVHDAFVDLGLDRFLVGPDVDADTLHRIATTAAAAPEEFRQAAGRVSNQGAVARAYVTSVVKGVG